MQRNPSDQPFVEQYRSAYQELSKYAVNLKEMDIEALSVTKRNAIIESYKFTRALYNFLPPSRPTGIGSGAHIIRPQLTRNTDAISLESAIDFGKTLIEYASRVDTTVGPPSQFDFCLATVTQYSDIFFQILGPQQVSIEKILYRFP